HAPTGMGQGIDSRIIPSLDVVLQQESLRAIAGDIGDETVFDGEFHGHLYTALPRNNDIARLQDNAPLCTEVAREAGNEAAGPVVPARGLVHIAPLAGNGQVR